MYKDMNDFESNAEGINAINNSIRNILMTRRGSVPGKPRFGSDLYKIIFYPLDHLTEAMARNFIMEALNEFETRIIVSDIVFKKVEEYNKLIININFRYKDVEIGTSSSALQGQTAISFNL
jgi:phage baseplate assembly protein W